jgi:hypothetical protein
MTLNKKYILAILVLSTASVANFLNKPAGAEKSSDAPLAQGSFMDEQVQSLTNKKESNVPDIKASSAEKVVKPEKEKKGLFGKLKKGKPIEEKKPVVKVQESKPVSPKEDLQKPIAVAEPKVQKQETATKSEDAELSKITKDRKENTKKTIDAINFIQPSIDLTKEEQTKIDMNLTKAEQEQLTVLWRATLERNKTIRFIVEKLTPDDKNKKKNQIMSQILNTAIFLPFYALQTVAPTDTSSLASYIGAGLASDLINGKAQKNSDKMQLSQTEMVIMFSMIDQIAERVREQYHSFKQEKIDAALAEEELQDAKSEAAASLDMNNPQARFLSQIRIRQIERELRRIKLRLRSSRIVLVDLSGPEAVEGVEMLIDREVAALLELPANV